MGSSATDGDGKPPALPEVVRARLVELTAEVLPQVSRLPPPLRKVAGFAPGRRARLGATPIAVELDRSPGFREHVMTQLRIQHPELASLAGAVPAAAEPVDLAAISWLARSEDWDEVYREAVHRIEQRISAESLQRDEETLTRTVARLAELEQALETERAERRAEIADLKRQNSALRSKLGESRAAERRARALLEETGTDAAVVAEAVTEAGGTAASEPGEPRDGSAEVRRLRKQLAELRAQLTAARHSSRAERAEGTLRARILLDTLIEAASGLRRELALPAVDGAPSDRIEAEIAAEEARLSSGVGSLGQDSPALLEQYLTMPRARLIVDGYNVSKLTWPSSSLEAQRHLLVSGLAGLVARTGAETTVVFDGAESPARGVGVIPRGVKVLFSPLGVIADDVIRDIVAVEPAGRLVIVVTNDREIVDDVVRAGARAARVEGLVPLLA